MYAPVVTGPAWTSSGRDSARSPGALTEGPINFVAWRRYGNSAWPVIYLIDRRGKIRFVQVGEGRYAETEQEIETLLSER